MYSMMVSTLNAKSTSLGNPERSEREILSHPTPPLCLEGGREERGGVAVGGATRCLQGTAAVWGGVCGRSDAEEGGGLGRA